MLEIAGLRENRVLAARVSRPVSSPIHCAQLIFEPVSDVSVIITCRDDFVYICVEYRKDYTFVKKLGDLGFLWIS